MSRSRVWGVLACAVTVAVVAGVWAATSMTDGPGEGTPRRDEVALRFDIDAGGEQITAVTNSGTATTRQRVVVAGDGSLLGQRSPFGRVAADYPDFSGSAAGPRAVVAVTNAGTEDELDPGAAEFMFGADIRLDAVSTGSVADNGNNVIQRGLFSEAAQYKIQIDHGRASCRVKGERGDLDEESRLVMAASAWYRVVCARQVSASGDQLELEVTPVNPDGTLGAGETTSSAVVPVGSTHFDIGTPLSVGGKLTPDVRIVEKSDQFNGWIDNVFFRVL